MTKALLKAAAAGDAATLTALLDAGADIDWTHKGTVLSTLAKTALAGQTAALRLLAARGATVEAPDKAMGRRPLAWAASLGHDEAAEALLALGADPLAVAAPSRHSTLMSAAQGGHAAVVARLIAAGADRHQLSADGRDNALALARAKDAANVVDLLLAAGARDPAAPAERPALPRPQVELTGPADRSSLEAVLRRFLLLMERWERAAATRDLSKDGTWPAIQSDLEVLFAECCIVKKRPFSRQGSFRQPPEHDAGHRLIEAKAAAPRRVELVVRAPPDSLLRFEYLFVALKTKDGWRIDGKKIPFDRRAGVDNGHTVERQGTRPRPASGSGWRRGRPSLTPPARSTDKSRSPSACARRRAGTGASPPFRPA